MTDSAKTQRRYFPSRPFPPYAFLPGQDAHPTRDPKGHSYTGESEPPADYFEPEDWSQNADYLYGADLYNHGYLWEAHEAWEGLWHAAKHDDLQAEHLQGLIQCAASALKVRMEQPAGVTRLAEIGTGRLERVAQEAQGQFMGVDLDDFVEAFRSFAASQPETPDERPRLDLRAR